MVPASGPPAGATRRAPIGRKPFRSDNVGNSSSGRAAPDTTMQEQRPVYRIATAGLDPRDVRLIEIVFKHSQYNRFEFVLDDGKDPHSIDVLLVNTTTPEGLQAVSAVRRQARQIPVVAAVPRGVPSPARHAISIDRLTLQLLPILNKVVESELLSPETQPMTVPLPHEGPRFAGAWQPPPAAGAPGVAGAAPAPGRAHPEGLPRPGDPARGPLPATNATSRPMPAARPEAAPAGARPVAPEPARQAPQAGAGRPTPSPRSDPVSPAPRQEPSSRATPSGAPRPPPAPSGPARSGTRDAAAPPRPAGRRPRILVVDDSPTVRQQLGVAFTRMGFACELVARGEEALERLAAGRYDLVMADVMIPDMDGFKLTRAIRKQHRSLPVIILSSRGSAFDHARGLLAGCKAYLVKPVPLRELDAAILKVLKRSVPPAELEALLRNAAAARAAASRSAAVRAAARRGAAPDAAQSADARA